MKGEKRRKKIVETTDDSPTFLRLSYCVTLVICVGVRFKKQNSFQPQNHLQNGLFCFVHFLV